MLSDDCLGIIALLFDVTPSRELLDVRGSCWFDLKAICSLSFNPYSEQGAGPATFIDIYMALTYQIPESTFGM